MNTEEKARLAEFKLQGTLTQDQAVEYHKLLSKEEVKEVEKVEPYVKEPVKKYKKI